MAMGTDGQGQRSGSAQRAQPTAAISCPRQPSPQPPSRGWPCSRRGQRPLGRRAAGETEAGAQFQLSLPGRCSSLARGSGRQDSLPGAPPPVSVSRMGPRGPGMEGQRAGGGCHGAHCCCPLLVGLVRTLYRAQPHLQHSPSVTRRRTQKASGEGEVLFLPSPRLFVTQRGSRDPVGGTGGVW